MQWTRYKQQRGATDLVTKILLGGILVVLVILVGVLLWRGGGGDQGTQSGGAGSGTGQEKPVVQAGQTVSRPPQSPPPPPTIGRPDRIRDVLQEGKTYEVITTADLTAPVRDKDWGFEKIVHLAYRAEVCIHRKIEKNDGHRVVELRQIRSAQMLKATSTVKFECLWAKLAGSLVMGFLEGYLGGTGEVTALSAAVLDAIFKAGIWAAEQALNEQNTKVKAMLDSLKGKSVRITYEDGRGVVSLVPVGCTLTEEERDFLFASAVVTDAFLMPDKASKPGDEWEVDGRAFVDFLPPSWRGVTSGQVWIRREQDFEENGQKYALLRCYRGTLRVNATDQTRTRLATLTPQGELKYNITKGHIESGNLTLEGSITEASRDHLLFEARFETQPKCQATYSCKMVD
jgi:hypothetical protein